MTSEDLPDKYSKEGPYIYDNGDFTLDLTRFGLWRTRDRNGVGLCSGLDKDAVIYWSREHINGFKTSTATTTRVKFGDGYKL
jgi:hypothetical protein